MSMFPQDKLLEASLAATRNLAPEDIGALLGWPTVIVSAPRSGSNLLFELLTNVDGIWTIGRESHALYNVFPHLRAENATLDSGSLHEAHADPETRRLWRAMFLYMLRDRHGRPLLAHCLRPSVLQGSTCSRRRRAARSTFLSS
jgi:hypothetical protein